MLRSTGLQRLVHSSARLPGLKPAGPTRAVPLTARLRTFSSTLTASTSLEEWTQTIKSQSTTMHDTADLNKARQLLLVLPNLTGSTSSVTSSPSLLDKHTGEEALALNTGSVMPLGSELVLFNPLLSESTLGSDGTERTFGPPGGLDQRMWASGSFEFEQGKSLRVGQNVKCEVVVENVQPKEGAKTGMMVLVTRRLVYSNLDGVVLTERRTHVYRKQRPAEQRRYMPPPADKTPKAKEGEYRSMRRLPQ